MFRMGGLEKNRIRLETMVKYEWWVEDGHLQHMSACANLASLYVASVITHCGKSFISTLSLTAMPRF